MAHLKLSEQDIKLLLVKIVKELTEERELFGEKIFINQLTGNAKVSGSKNKPVRFILNIESGDKK